MIGKSKFFDVCGTLLLLIASLWAIRVFDILLPPDLNQLGIKPRTLAGLPGIFLMPFLHDSYAHLLNNTLPLIVLLALLFFTQEHPWRCLFWIVLLSGSLLWLVGREASHIGASALIFGLITYLIAAGLWHRRLVSSAVAVAVLVFYGGSLFWGVMPRLNSKVSWEGHLCGAVAGIALAWLSRRREQRELLQSGFELSRIANYEPPKSDS